MALEWESDRNGDEPWDGDTYLGCIYNRDSCFLDRKGWRVLGPDFERIADVQPAPLLSDAHRKARRLLEGAHASLLTAEELLNR